MNWAPDGREYVHQLRALLRTNDAEVSLHAPAVGRWRGVPAPGTRVVPGTALGELEILGVMHRMVAPRGAGGLVVADPDLPRRRPIAVSYGDRLLTLDPDASPAVAPDSEAAEPTAAGLVFPAPLSGRFYARPAPDQPPFVAPGDAVTVGQTVALLEVMKTFNRVVYGGEGLPEQAEVVSVVPDDQDDVESGDPILILK